MFNYYDLLFIAVFLKHKILTLIFSILQAKYYTECSRITYENKITENHNCEEIVIVVDDIIENSYLSFFRYHYLILELFDFHKHLNIYILN